MSKIERIMASGKLTNVKEARQKFVLRTLFVLIGFLDKAKSDRILLNDPCLFEKVRFDKHTSLVTTNVLLKPDFIHAVISMQSTPYKSSRILLEKMSNCFLCGEGDIIRHLGLLNVKTGYVQTPFDEFDYAVNNLACDLRDGVRLCRLVELHTKKWNLTAVSKLDAISHLHIILY